MKILLYDPVATGHHPLYVAHIARALARHHQVVVATPTYDPAIPAVDHLAVNTDGENDATRFKRAIVAARPDHAVHLFADSSLRGLLSRRWPVPITVLVFRPRAHYPSMYETPLGPRERFLAYAHDALVMSWRLHPSAHAVLVLDAGAVKRWRNRPGAPVQWLPEPPILGSPVASQARHGAIVYGRITTRKGLDYISRALTSQRSDVHLRLAGPLPRPLKPWLDAHVDAMRRSGVRVELDLRSHAPDEGLAALGRARCAVIPYVRHYGMSRVLLEAASVGTPVVATHRGLIGHLVREHALGLAVDCADPHAFRAALLEMCEGSTDYSAALARFVENYSPRRFESALESVFGRES